MRWYSTQRQRKKIQKIHDKRQHYKQTLQISKTPKNKAIMPLQNPFQRKNLKAKTSLPSNEVNQYISML